MRLSREADASMRSWYSATLPSISRRSDNDCARSSSPIWMICSLISLILAADWAFEATSWPRSPSRLACSRSMASTRVSATSPFDRSSCNPTSSSLIRDIWRSLDAIWASMPPICSVTWPICCSSWSRLPVNAMLRESNRRIWPCMILATSGSPLRASSSAGNSITLASSRWASRRARFAKASTSKASTMPRSALVSVSSRITRSWPGRTRSPSLTRICRTMPPSLC